MNDRTSRGDLTIRALAAATVIAIGAIAAVISYRHALGVARSHGETGLTAYLTPLTIDGLVLVASLVMLNAARRREQSPPLAWLALALGIAATIAVNVLYGLEHGPVGAVIAAWPAVTLVVVVELLMGMIRRGRTRSDQDEDRSRPGLGVVATADPEPVAEAAPDVAEPVAAAVEVGPVGDELAPLVATARSRYGDLLASGVLPSIRAIRREMRVGHPRARAIQAALAQATALRAA